MSLYKHIAVSASELSRRPFWEQVEYILQGEGRPDVFILREKKWGVREYTAMARRLQKLCGERGVEFFCNYFVESALEIGCKNMQMGLDVAKAHVNSLGLFEQLWISVHSVEEAKEAEALGASGVIFGHIFRTACKEGLEGRGLEALEEVVGAVGCPVYAIGGVKAGAEELLKKAGAAGDCRMSSYMAA